MKFALVSPTTCKPVSSEQPHSRLNSIIVVAKRTLSIERLFNLFTVYGIYTVRCRVGKLSIIFQIPHADGATPPDSSPSSSVIVTGIGPPHMYGQNPTLITLTDLLDLEESIRQDVEDVNEIKVSNRSFFYISFCPTESIDPPQCLQSSPDRINPLLTSSQFFDKFRSSNPRSLSSLRRSPRLKLS